MQNAPQPTLSAAASEAKDFPARSRLRQLQMLLPLVCVTGIAAAGLWQSELVFWYTITATTTLGCISVLWRHGERGG